MPNKQVQHGSTPVYKKMLRQKLKAKHLLYQHILRLQLRVMTVFKPVVCGPKATPALSGKVVLPGVSLGGRARPSGLQGPCEPWGLCTEDTVAQSPRQAW